MPRTIAMAVDLPSRRGFLRRYYESEDWGPGLDEPI